MVWAKEVREHQLSQSLQHDFVWLRGHLQSQQLQLPCPLLLPVILQPSICFVCICTMSLFWGGLGKKSPRFMWLMQKLEAFKVLWVSIPKWCILKGTLSQRRENHRWPIYEGIAAVLLYCFVWVIIIEWSDTFTHNNKYFICELPVSTAALQ